MLGLLRTNAVLLLTLTIYGCGGGGEQVANNKSSSESLECASTVELPYQEGYPVHRFDGVDPTVNNRCEVLRYYRAGYAVVMPKNISPWNLEQSDAVNISYSEVQGVSSIDEISQVESTGSEESERDSLSSFVVAKLIDKDSESTPWNCAASGINEEELDSNIQLCISNLKSSSAEYSAKLAKASLRDGTPADASKGGATPGAVWTNLGVVSYPTSYTGKLELSLIDKKEKGTIHTGAVIFDVYRLNGVDSFEYYLVRAKVNSTPLVFGCSRLSFCGYFNNKESFKFHLERDAGGSKVAGIVEEYAPTTTLRNKSTSFKIGGGLKVSGSEKGGAGAEGSVSAEFSVSYNYSAVEIKAAQLNDNSLSFDFKHATSDGIGGDLWDRDPTTLGPFSSTVWAIYKFPVIPNAQKVNYKINLLVDKYEGSFGRAAIGVVPIGVTHLYKYAVVPPKKGDVLRTDFNLPSLNIKQVVKSPAGREELVELPKDESIKVKRGQNLKFLVDSGGLGDGNISSTPLTVNWAVYSPPAFLSFDQTTGRGKSTINATVNSGGVAGDRSYIRFNASPRGAVPGLEMSDISVPIEVVE